MNSVGIPAILTAKPGSLLVIDEIGKMELMAGDFIRAIENVIDKVHLLGTIYAGYKSDSRLIGLIKRYGIKVLELSRENRDYMFNNVISELRDILGIV